MRRFVRPVDRVRDRRARNAGDEAAPEADRRDDADGLAARFAAQRRRAAVARCAAIHGHLTALRIVRDAVAAHVRLRGVGRRGEGLLAVLRRIALAWRNLLALLLREVEGVALWLGRRIRLGMRDLRSVGRRLGLRTALRPDDLGVRVVVLCHIHSPICVDICRKFANRIAYGISTAAEV